MSKLGTIMCLFLGSGLACCLTTWAQLHDRRTLREKYEHWNIIKCNELKFLDCGTVTISREQWSVVTDIVETAWQNHTNRLAKAQLVRERAKAAAKQAAESRKAKGLERVRDIRRAAEEARKGGRQ